MNFIYLPAVSKTFKNIVLNLLNFFKTLIFVQNNF